MAKPTPTPLTAPDCARISRALVLWMQAFTKPRTQQRSEAKGLIARFEAHSYRYRVALEQAALIARNPDL